MLQSPTFGVRGAQFLSNEGKESLHNNLVPTSADTSPASRALWFIEAHFDEEITLDDIAQIAGVSRFHLTRAFGYATGHSVMSYVRGRRLSAAARKLADGAPDILAVAVESGYGSHEAFTRAFKDQFGITPEALRAQGHLNNIQLLAAIRMQPAINLQLAPPRFENGRPILVAGFRQQYTAETSWNMPAQWQRFVPHIGHIPGQIGKEAYGVVGGSDAQGNMDYLCGVEVSDFNLVPAEYDRMRIPQLHNPEQQYAVFTHPGNVASIKTTWMTIFTKWMPECGLKMVQTPDFELYKEDFDGRTGEGGVEIWIPVEK